ncbi:MAG: tRNA dimethylallyltransferase [Myxococcaceae bacterium]|nr:tRNA dimethylallyltransferase [Myxococcaceae bacterium]
MRDPLPKEHPLPEPDASAPLLVITGPTASGKTQLAVELALALDAELVGADSVQVYRGFDLGSSKPNAAELRGISHHLLDVCEPGQELDAAAFASLADRAIADIRARGKLAIVVGGSGLWLRALLRGLVPLPKVDPVLRAQLHAEGERLGAPALHRQLRALDPLAAAQVHENDLIRIVRGLEVHAQTGEALGELRARHALGAPRYRALRVILDWPQELLNLRIRERTQQMFAAGFVDEVRGLLAQHGEAPRALASVGYREVVAFLRQPPEAASVSLEQTIEQVERSTRIYARRQRTWLKNEPGDAWLATPSAVLSEDGRARLRAFLEPGG